MVISLKKIVTNLVIETLQETLDMNEDDKQAAAIKKWRPVMTKAGFGEYAIDFSDCDAELVERIGQTCAAYLKEKFNTL